MTETALDIVVNLLPQSGLGKTMSSIIVVMLVLVVSGKFRLEWFGQGIRYMFRWTKCQLFKSHSYEPAGFGYINMNTMRLRGPVTCVICRSSEWRG